jgi:IS30 family transposase
VDPGANFGLAAGRKRTSSAGGGLRDDLCLHLSGGSKGRAVGRYLTRRHKRRRPRRSRPQDTIKDRVSIHERPKTVDGRTEGGHWEGDLIICKRTRPVLVLHERKSRVTLAARLAGKTAAETISVMLSAFARIEPALRKSITFDNDTAFAQHALLRTMRAMTTWFCDDYASWQKGGGRKRQRSTTPLVASSDGHRPNVRRGIQDIVITTNLTPRKMPGLQSKRSSKSLAKTCKSGSHSPVALGSRIQAQALSPLLVSQARLSYGRTLLTASR